MNALNEVLARLGMSAGIERLGWSLVHSLWLFSAIAVVALILDRAARQCSAAVRYGVLLAAMLLIVVAPVGLWFTLPADAPISRTPVVSSRGHVPEDHGATEQDLAHVNSTRTSSIEQSPEPATTSGRTSNHGNAIPDESPITWWAKAAALIKPWLFAIVAVWCCGVFAFSVRPVLSWYTVRRLSTFGVESALESVQQALQRMQVRLGVRRSVRVLQSTLVNTPVVVGCFRSVILLPASLISGLPMQQVEAILAHELAHVRRYDYLVNLLQTVVETLFFYHPAVWWLSHRIRTERENCCDDLVVAALGDRIQYARALLAIEEYRGAVTALAMSARGGSLLKRVQRLARGEAIDRRNRVGSLIALAIPGIASFAFVVWGIAFGYALEDRDMPFGPESHGLQCRLVALLPDANEESPDLKRTANTYSVSSEMTFGVELKNVSEQTLILAGVQYGEGYKIEGQANSNFFAPHLFEFSFTDEQGKAVPRTQRAYCESWSVLDGASAHELAPGESLTVVLRPAHFHVPMDYDLPPGRFQATVHYRGPDDHFREQVGKHWPNKKILQAWPHEVVSNSVDFTIEKPSNRAKPDDLVWGDVQEGLQAAIELRVPESVEGNPVAAPGVPVGTALGVVFHVRNESDKAITFVSETGRQGDHVTVTNERGEKVEVLDKWISGWPIDVEHKLKPGETAQLHVLAPAINTIDQPGQYKIRYTIRFNSRVQKDEQGNVIFPRPGDYQSELVTGETQLFLREVPVTISANGEIHGRLIDDETGEPIRDAVVACGAVINDSGRGGGHQARTDSAGRYRLQPPSPGIYNVWLKEYRDSSMTAAADDGILVEAGKVSTSELRLTRGRRVTGKVVLEDGAPVPRIVVSCYSAARPQSTGVQSVRTKEDGTFLFTLPPGFAHVYTLESVARTDGNPLGVGRSADAMLDVPDAGELPPITLTLQRRESQFGSDAWLKQSSRGTQIIRHENAADVTGTVVNVDGLPLAGARVFKYDGPSVTTNERGEFRVVSEKGTQFVMHVFHSGYHVWYGTPTAGDELKVVMHKKGSLTAEQQGRSRKVRVIDAESGAPIAGVTIEAVCWEGERDKTVDGIATTDADGVVEFDGLEPVRYHWRLSAKQELPYISTWRSSGPTESEVVIRLHRACELVLRAVDAETGRGIAGVKFGRERALAEYWMQVVVPDTLGAQRPVRYDFDVEPQVPPEADYETDADGYYRCLVGPEAWSYMVYQHPEGYKSIVPIDGRQEVEIATPSGARVEYTFRLIRDNL